MRVDRRISGRGALFPSAWVCARSERFPKTTPTNCVFGKRSPWVNVFQKRCSRVDQPKSYTFWCEQRGRSVTSAVNVTHKGERRARLPLFCSPLWCIHSAWSRDQEKRRVSGKRSLWVNTFQKRCSSWLLKPHSSHAKRLHILV